ncbi:hypothetical protein VT72_06330 [Clostridium botulinum]|uniref:Uncharacterized protein n=1 Tax=Clostridium botulinum (strain Langeland / NCTC 10281 / Type F) TaxID=441772 RepID=A7GD76_CLOBL|nr:hypothetical protein CLI_1471 [Clostridium botulinum F str. Langeland]ADF99186.1 hypothetical protein CBF_1447 [Clostridium botulinum F str. 230613]KKM43255.1 hypothetical protein VT72_06330 [Clostridium botulinum]
MLGLGYSNTISIIYYYLLKFNINYGYYEGIDIYGTVFK